MTNDHKTLEDQLQSQLDAIEDAIARTRDDQPVEIEDMDKEVAQLCRDILEADRETSLKLESKMVEMITKLDTLAVELKEFKDRKVPKDGG